MLEIFLSPLHFIAFFIYFSLSIYIFFHAQKKILIYLFSGVLFLFAVWSFGYIFVHSNSVSQQGATLFTNINSIGWVGIATMFLAFSIKFAEKKWFNFFSVFILIALPALLIYQQWAGNLIVEHQRLSYGWSIVWADNIWPYLFFLYYLVFFGVALFLIFMHGRKAGSLVVKKQCKIIILGVLVSLAAGFLTDIIFPLLKNYSIPNMGDVFSLFWAVSMVYAITRYQLLGISTAIAAETIIDNITDTLLLINEEKKIVKINKAATDLFGCDQECTLLSMNNLFEKDKKIQKFIDKALANGQSEANYHFDFRTKKKNKIKALFSITAIRDKNNRIVGGVIIIKDITNRIRMEEDLKEKVAEMERINKSMVGRELKLIELKNRIKELEAKCGEGSVDSRIT
jgi:PAS domain S-box-containing protein